MIKGDPQGLDTSRTQFAEVDRVLAEYSCVHTLVEIHASLDGVPPSTQHRSFGEAEVPNLGNDLPEARRCDDVVIHEDEVLLGPVKVLDPPHDTGQGFRVALCAFEFWHSTKRATPDAATRRIGEVGVANGILILHLIENPVVGNQILDWR